jgi:hypothetical protein
MCLIGLGLFFVSPVTLWTLTEKWKTQGGERPTKEKQEGAGNNEDPGLERKS